MPQYHNVCRHMVHIGCHRVLGTPCFSPITPFSLPCGTPAVAPYWGLVAYHTVASLFSRSGNQLLQAKRAS